MEAEPSNLHVVMLPWLAMGHLLPFFELSKQLARKGLRISFFSSPGNLRRLPSLPPSLTSLFDFIPCPIPPIENLPHNIDNTVDIHSEDARPLLDQAYAAFERHLSSFLSDPARPKPDWVIYDFAAAKWAPALAARFSLCSAFFSLFNAAVMSFLTPNDGARESPEDLTRPPEQIPFPTAVAFRPFEARYMYPMLPKKPSSTSSDHDDQPEAGLAAPESQMMLIRTCSEFEPKWLALLSDMNKHLMKVVPVGFLPPSFHEEEKGEAWAKAREWLDGREPRSVVYAAFGTEAKLTRKQIEEIAVGLEISRLPFLWALRTGEPPEGLEERAAGRGMVCRGWVPQARLLAHSAVGGFLTHGGWNSMVEGLAVGTAMVVLPMIFEQGLNARHLEETGFGLEVVRDYEDGSFTGKEIARKLRMVMVEDEGEELRVKARKWKDVFGSEKVQEGYVFELVKQLWEKRMSGTSQI